MIIECGNCGKRYTINDNKIKGANPKVKCLECGTIIVIKKPESEFVPGSVDHSYLSPSSEVGTVSPELSEKQAKTTKPKKSVFTGLKLRTKFNIAMGTLFLICIISIYFIAGNRLHKDAEKQVFDKARLLLITMESSRSFTSKVIKPVLYKALPGKFIVEGMSSSFGARNIFERISKFYPQYYFKHAAPNPRNPINKASAVEMDIINKFQADPALKEWKGFSHKNGKKVYMIMKPIVAKKSCLRCHSTPELAPAELVERYGTKNGFGRKVGEVIGTLTISVPASIVLKTASNNTLIFIGIVFLFFIILALIINFLFGRVILQPINKLSEVADKISIGELDAKIDVSGNDEISNLAESFKRMRTSIKIAFDRLEK
ncbi:MAG: zinc-ribbon domain-containing protein [Desulfobacteraceae bacterium]|nr:zinc-ribbon domain-containing protein [Desulfobacteraceae bacterium]